MRLKALLYLAVLIEPRDQTTASIKKLTKFIQITFVGRNRLAFQLSPSLICLALACIPAGCNKRGKALGAKNRSLDDIPGRINLVFSQIPEFNQFIIISKATVCCSLPFSCR